MSERVRDLPQSGETPVGDCGSIVPLCQGPQGEVVGVAIFLSTAELLRLGVDPEESDAMVVQVVNRELQLEPRNLEGADRP
jgi:hypothetical protein